MEKIKEQELAVAMSNRDNISYEEALATVRQMLAEDEIANKAAAEHDRNLRIQRRSGGVCG